MLVGRLAPRRPSGGWPRSRPAPAAAAQRPRATRAGAERYRELIGLSLVLEVGAPLDLHMAPVALGTQERLRLALQRGEGGGEIAWVEVGQRPQEGAHEVVLHLGLEETEGAPHAGSGGHE